MRILDEEETLDAVLQGGSITRFGDGEFKIAHGAKIKSQEADPELAKRLRWILRREGPWITAIPRVIPDTPKGDYWKDFMSRPWVKRYLGSYQYGSALITRPDSAPHIMRPEYFKKVTQIWQGRRVCLIWGGSTKSLMPWMLRDAEHLDIITAPGRHAWADHKRILAQVEALPKKPDVCILTLGPTATALVPDIHNMGIQAVDLGHIGMWLRRVMKERKGFNARHGYFWPRGAEEYGKRYIDRAPDMDTAISLCRDTRSAIQAGGHVGVWPKYLAERFSRVYTFEPEMLNFQALNMNCTEQNIYRLQAALGFERTPVKIVVHPANIGGNHVSGVGRVPCLRIDDLALRDVDLIVLDVEGSELAAIYGAVDTIKLCKPVIHMEARGHIEKYNRGTTEELHSVLRTLGYEKHGDIHKDEVWTNPNPPEDADQEDD